MTLASLLVHDVTILTPALVEDDYGNEVRDWDSSGVGEADAKGWVSQNSGTEEAADRQAHVSDWVLYLHPDVAIGRQDRVLWEGIVFEVDGPANPAWTPRGLHHLEVPLRVVDG